ncbi:ribonuclease D [Alcanivorax xiamenensis]|uniref:Ribonuclease D n=1 Tax=Alcanivorax xiamenensis TaxID=1177156 RepID=A0ABQ6YAD8_9GAMM|nr:MULTISPECIES: ribonuclease D [Alcanivorax]KAF0806640.1 ribonuclease D [Alcanivorax xiamenensis]
MSYIWCDTDERIQDWQPAAGPLYLDTEFMRERTYWPRLALVQAHDGDAIRLIDTTRVTATALGQVLADRCLVMHSCSEDLEALQYFTGQCPGHIEDTQIAAALVGEDMQMSYQRLVEQLLGVALPKGATRTDWLKRPLSAEQLSYAEDDVKYLPEVTGRLRERLHALGREAWWREECDRLVADVRRRGQGGEPWHGVKGAGALQGEALAALAELARWREETARQRDLPRSFVLKDPVMLELSRRSRVDRSALQSLGLHPKLVQRDGERIIACLQQGRRQAPPEPLPEPLDRPQRDRVKQLRDRVTVLAGDLGLQPEVLVRRRWLEALVRDPASLPEPLRGWRREPVAEPLLEML